MRTTWSVRQLRTEVAFPVRIGPVSGRYEPSKETREYVATALLLMRGSEVCIEFGGDLERS